MLPILPPNGRSRVVLPAGWSVIIDSMQSRQRFILLVVILLVLVISLVYWWSVPRLLVVSPPDGAYGVLSAATLRLSFSRSMQEVSVIERLVIEPSMAGSFTWERNTLVFTPQNPWPSGATVKVRLKAGSRAISLFPSTMGREANWSFTIGQPRLAYLYPANLPAQIYFLDPGTGESETVTGVPGGVQDFDVSADGAAVYFSAQDTQASSSIFRLDLRSLSQPVVPSESAPSPIVPVPIVACPQASCRVLAISPKADFLAFEKTAFPEGNHSGYPQVWVAPLTGNEAIGSPVPEAALMIAGDPNHQTLMPAWSKDGLLAFYDVNAAEFIFFDPRKGERARFPNQTGQPGAWHPNGRYFLAPEIFFLDSGVSSAQSEMKSLAESHLILFDWQSGVTRDLTTGEGVEDAAPAYSPDGAFLAFARKYLDVNQWTPGRQIWLMETESGEARPLTDDPLFNHFDFSWNSSGDRLAYVRFDQSSMTGPPSIWMVDLNTNEATQLVEGGYSPFWLPP
jgi:Tol biopolymer transport system component